MLKMKSIISKLQDETHMYLDALNSEYIIKIDGMYYINFNYETSIGDLKDVKEFIHRNESIFIDMFSSQEKYQGKVNKTVCKKNSHDDSESEAIQWLKKDKVREIELKDMEYKSLSHDNKVKKALDLVAEIKKRRGL